MGPVLSCVVWISVVLSLDLIGLAKVEESFRYDMDFLSLQDFICGLLIDPYNELLYCPGPNTPDRHTKKDPKLGVPVNILTCCNLRTGQCERIALITPADVHVIDISPNGRWLMLSTMVFQDPQKPSPETAEYARELADAKTFQKIYIWSEKDLHPFEFLPPSSDGLLQNEELLFFQAEKPED